jgi:transposase-like protein
MEIPIREQVEFDLSNIHRAVKVKVIADKIKCIKMLSRNFKKSQIAELLEIGEKTVYNWKHEFISAKNVQEFIAPDIGNHKGKLSDLKKTSL